MAKRTHGLSKERLYAAWNNILFRCNNPKCKGYKNYGARGIGVCQEWAENFTAFYEWALTNGYKDGLSIVRKDPNGNYCPENCCWVLPGELGLHRRDTIYIDYRGTKIPLRKIVDEFGLDAARVEEFLKKQYALMQ